MTNIDSQRIKEIRDNTAKMADAFTRIADVLERLADCKTEPMETMSCQECKHFRENMPCRPYIVGLECKYEPKDEPQIQMNPELIDKPIGYEVISVEGTLNMDEPQYDMDNGTIKCDNCSENGSYKCTKCDGEMYFKRLAVEDEPQTERSE